MSLYSTASYSIIIIQHVSNILLCYLMNSFFFTSKLDNVMLVDYDLYRVLF